jgi:hypothetical protein
VLTRWGLAGLLGFEAILGVYAFTNGSLDHAAMAVVAAAALAWAIVAHARTGTLPRAALAILALVTLARALRQTAFVGAFPPGVLPTFLVPLGFALLLAQRARPAIGVGLVAAARTWFVAWYFLHGSTVLAVANLVGALGAWIWWAEDARVARPEAAEEGTAQP